MEGDTRSLNLGCIGIYSLLFPPAVGLSGDSGCSPGRSWDLVFLSAKLESSGSWVLE